MSSTQFTTDQYKDKSITSAKLADDITITNLTASSIVSGNCKLVAGDGLTKNGSTLTSSNGFIFKYSTVDLVHIDDSGNVYIKGNLEIGGTMNSITTTAETLEVADSEIVLNAGVAEPYAGGAKVTVDRGGANFDPYLMWDESGDYWKLYDGTNTARIIDQTYGDGRYINVAGDTMTGQLSSSFNMALVSKLSSRKSWVFHHPASNNLILAPSTSVDAEDWDWAHQITFTDAGDISIANLTTSGDITVNGNRLTFGNGSAIDNETNGRLTLTGDSVTIIYGESGGNYFSVDSTSALHATAADGYAWFQMDGSTKKLGFGPGSSTRDTWLYRDASNSLKTDGALNITGKASVGTFRLGTSTTAGYVLTADASGNGSWAVLPSDKYLSAVAGTCGGTITFTVTNGSNVTWSSAHTHANDHASGSDNQNLFSSVVVNKTGGTATGTGEGTISASSQTTSLGIIAGSNVTLNHDTTNKVMKISAVDTTYSAGNGIALTGTAFSVDALTGAECTSQGSAGEIAVLASGIYAKLGTAANTAAAGNHAHANLVAGNGITGTTYTGSATQTWSIASHAGTSGSVGTIVIGTDTVGVSLGNTGTTACAGNDARLSDARTPVAHGDSLHNHMKYARITYTGGTSNIGYQWNHALNSANVVFMISSNVPEGHHYYSVVDNNNVKIYLDDVPYETIVLDVVAILPNSLTTATANLTS